MDCRALGLLQAFAGQGRGRGASHLSLRRAHRGVDYDGRSDGVADNWFNCRSQDLIRRKELELIVPLLWTFRILLSVHGDSGVGSIGESRGPRNRTGG